MYVFSFIHFYVKFMWFSVFTVYMVMILFTCFFVEDNCYLWGFSGYGYSNLEDLGEMFGMVGWVSFV